MDDPIFRSSTGLETIHWHTMHSRYLGPDAHVLDLGANYGRFAIAMAKRFDCNVVAVEPTPLLHATMLEHPRVKKLPYAIAAENGTTEFHISSQSTASSMTKKDATTLETVTVETRRLDALVNDLDWCHVDLLKCDIEGAEIDVLDSLSDVFLHGRVRQMTIEFHDFCGITPPTEVKRTLDRLHRLGFFSVRMSRVGHQDTWLINRLLCRISLAECLWLRHVTRNLFGLQRVAGRVLGPRRHG